MSDEDGKLFVKPCVQAEIDFYESAQRDHPEVAHIMPVFMGTLMLTDSSDQRIGDTVAGVISDAGNVTTHPDEIAAAVTEQVARATGAEKVVNGGPVEWIPTKGGKIRTDKAVVLENLAHGFTKPNILDIKLGVRLWADDAPEKKKIKFTKVSAETTHRDFGFRIAGMRVYKGSDDASRLDDFGYMVYDKDYGRTTVNDENLVSEMRRFVINPASDIDQDLSEAICTAFTAGIEHIEDVLTRHETRMFSASLLFIYEGDGPTLREAIEVNNVAVETVERARTTKRIDSGIVMEEGDEDEDELAEMVEGLPPTFAVKVIDFAHASWADGMGPDENMLKGVRSVRKIFKGFAGDG